jgi:hypothetical protein
MRLADLNPTLKAGFLTFDCPIPATRIGSGSP